MRTAKPLEPKRGDSTQRSGAVKGRPLEFLLLSRLVGRIRGYGVAESTIASV
jgi:hypothetical protein